MRGVLFIRGSNISQKLGISRLIAEKTGAKVDIIGTGSNKFDWI
jgi:hypothetical protein